MKTIYYLGKPADGFGWGICNKYLIAELSKWFHVEQNPPRGMLHKPCFVPIADANLTPTTSVFSTKPVFGYTFNEFPLGDYAVRNARFYNAIFCGSSWCANRLREAGIENAQVLVQGVDHGVFKPKAAGRKDDGKLRIFSGGKFEYRKGQDIVLAAVRALAKTMEVKLTAAWFNHWPLTMDSMTSSDFIEYNHMKGSWPTCYFAHLRQTLRQSDIDPEMVQLLPPLDQEGLAQQMQCSDIGIFPNRCEGGTNLVLMEYLACGKPAIVSNGTGHLDIIDGSNCLPVDGEADDNDWTHVPPVAVVNAVEKLRKNQDKLTQLGEVAHATMQQWTWTRAAEQVRDVIESV